MARSAQSVLILTGSMGAGKTTVMNEASDLLRLEGIHHASIDLDVLGIPVLPASQTDSDVSNRNLECVWANYAELGLTRLLLARAIESRADLEGLQRAVISQKWVICRLCAGIGTMEERVRSREPGIMQEQLVGRVQVLEKILDSSGLEDFCVVNEGRPVTEVARDVLVRAGWLKPSRT